MQVLNLRTKKAKSFLVGHTFRRCPQPAKEENDDGPSFSPAGTPPHGGLADHHESATAGSGDEKVSTRRADDDDQW